MKAFLFAVVEFVVFVSVGTLLVTSTIFVVLNWESIWQAMLLK